MKTFAVNFEGTNAQRRVEKASCVVVAADIENVLIKVKDCAEYKAMLDTSNPEITLIRKLSAGVHFI